jgi:hypothetical protein
MKNETKKIEYKCVKTTQGATFHGFVKDKIYKGRTYNGLYEISEEWASHKPTYLLEKKEFDKYFQLIETQEPHYA